MYLNLEDPQIMHKWGNIIKESIGVTNPEKVKWMAQYAHVHSLKESNQPLNESNAYATLGNIQGMGATKFPDNPTTQLGFRDQRTGSGDKAPTLLPLALQVAAQTIGFDLVPVQPMSGPMGMLAYMDYTYAGGRLDGVGVNVPEVVKVGNLTADQGNVNAPAPVAFKYVGKSRIDGKSIFQVLGTVPTGSNLQAEYDALTSTTGVSIDLVKALEDHITGFSGSTYDNNNPYSRQDGEVTQERQMGLQLESKSVEAKTFQVAASVTREQIQDLKQYGIDAVQQIETILINELSQSINKNILSRLFEMGDLNHANIIATTGTNFFLNISDSATTVGAAFPNTFVNVPAGTTLNATEVTNSASENQLTRQRKLYSKVLAAANMINVRGRRGPGNFVVVGGQLATALQDVAGFIAAPLANTITQSVTSLMNIGQIAGVQIFVDTAFLGDYTDPRFLVGRKGDTNSTGLVFMPYILADTVHTIAEGTMAPKMAIKSRYALVEAGRHPETNYITSAVYVNPALGGSLV